MINHSMSKQFSQNHFEDSEKIRKKLLFRENQKKLRKFGKITSAIFSLAIISGLSVIGVSLFYMVGWNILSMVIAG